MSVPTEEIMTDAWAGGGSSEPNASIAPEVAHGDAERLTRFIGPHEGALNLRVQ
jgi:hypothetical protein